MVQIALSLTAKKFNNMQLKDKLMLFWPCKINEKYDSSANFKHSKQNPINQHRSKRSSSSEIKITLPRIVTNFHQYLGELNCYRTKCFLPQLGAIEGN